MRYPVGQKNITRGPLGLLSSRVMSIFAISSRKCTKTLYTPELQEIIWELVAKKSADILSFRNSFITISSLGLIEDNDVVDVFTLFCTNIVRQREYNL